MSREPGGGRGSREESQAEVEAPVHAAADPTVGSAGLARAMLHAIRDRAVLVVARGGRITGWGPGAEALTGYTSDDIIGRFYGDLLADRAARQPVAPATGEVWWRRRDGERVNVTVTVEPVESDGEITGHIIIGQEPAPALACRNADADRRAEDRDALEREHELRAQVQAAERKAAFLAQASSILVATSLNFESTIRGLARLAVSRISDCCVVYSVSEDGEVRRMEIAHRDPRREDVLRALVNTPVNAGNGHPVKKAIGHRYAVISRTVPESFRQAIEQHGEVYAELAEVAGGGPLMVVPLIARGRVLGAVAFIGSARIAPYDLDDLELAEELGRRAAIAIDNARLYREAQEANRAKADFLAIMSHELRTPLNAIMGYADLIDAEISGPVNGRQHRQLSRIRASARHLLQLIEEILSFARTESGDEEVRLERITANDLVDEVVAVVEPLAAAKGIGFSTRLQHGRTVLETDPGKARQILVNILSNAVKFTEHGDVRLTFARDAGDALFTVEDTGIGIESRNLERIFDPFWQEQRPTTRRTGGTGLGLSVSRRLARMLRGGLRVRSDPGVGTMFEIRLPLRGGKAAEDRASTGRSRISAVS